MKIKDINKWLLNQKKKNKMKISKIDILDVENWEINNQKIYNYNKAFFSIVPFKFETNKKKDWFQPLIIQKEVGILGILKKKINNTDHYLLQAKVEPGNKNGVQLSPTVQATKSNYLQKHGGKKTNYLNFFVNNKLKIKTITKVKLSEQGTRYLDKANNNILIDLKNEKIKKIKNYIWVTKENLSYLLKKKNLLNMDTISVLSCSVKKNTIDNPVNNFLILINTLDNLKIKIKKKIVLFSELKDWKILKNKIVDIKKVFFSIIFLKIQASSREVRQWCQPIISDHNITLNGFLIQKIKKTNHYLLQRVQEPGLPLPKYTSTILVKNYSKNINKKNIKYFNFFKNKKNIKFINSDEGGRFFKNETHNLIYHLKDKKSLSLTDNYKWASHNQIIDLINKNLLTIEARNLFASFNIAKIH